MMNIRLIAEGDGDELLKWRNDPVTREMSLNAGIVSTGDHCTWLKSKLESSDCSLFLGVIPQAKFPFHFFVGSIGFM